MKGTPLPHDRAASSDARLTMSPTALALILLSAGFHAVWNALVKVSRDKQAFMWLIHLPSLVVVLPFFLASEAAPIPPIGWAMILASAIIHIFYAMSLGAAYTGGDLSLVYPLARSAPVFVLIWAVWWLGEHPTALGFAGIGLVVVGAYILGIEPGRTRRFWEPLLALRRRDVQWAWVTALLISLYHITDKVGVAVVAPLRFQYLMGLSRFVVYSVGIIPWKGRLLIKEARAQWCSIIAVSLLQFLAYQLVLIAMMTTPVSYV
ncbi:MAG TPA: EamA family transporter, partial [Candidatus Methylomirabilis sp.]